MSERFRVNRAGMISEGEEVAVVEQGNLVRDELLKLLDSQRLAVLATHGDGESYASLVAFAVDDNLQTLLFATNRETRKFAHVSANPRISLLVDNRSNEVSDFRAATAVTATGRASELSAAERDRYLETFLAKHPNLKEFVSDPSCALIRVGVDTYQIVSRFQDVVVLRLSSPDS